MHIYTPPTANEWKKAVKKAAGPLKGTYKEKEPLKVFLRFFFKRPPSHLKKNGELRKGINTQHVQKPDVDNLGKAILDALTDAELWHDDEQIVHLAITKYWAADWENEGVEIKVDHY